ncbi:formylglycine-generating enzyme family protein [bacterium]|nr:formylglycine-generating enzyme family protein [bacterium]
MKKVLFFGLAMLLCVNALCDEGWSDYTRFDGRQITEEPILLRPTDPITFSFSLVEGERKSLTIDVYDKDDPEINARLFAEAAVDLFEGTIPWHYFDEQYKDFPTDDIYILKKTVETYSEKKVFERAVTILPEPMALLALAFLGALFLRKRARLLAVVLMISMLAVSSAKAADGSLVSQVHCRQNWPFDRSVCIDFTLDTMSRKTYDVKFYGCFGYDSPLFDLAEKGTLSKEGADGTVVGGGSHRTLWTPDESFYETLREDLLIKVVATEQTPPGTGQYLVIDLSGGPEAATYPVSYLENEPEGGWTEEYKTTKMVLKLIGPGTFTMGSPEGELGKSYDETAHEVTLTKSFFAGVFEVTQKQFELVTGTTPSLFQGDARPVERVSYDMIRGAEEGGKWPSSNSVDEDSFLGILRSKTNLSFDLPTEAQWEYACRAETTTALNDGSDLSSVTEDAKLNDLARYWYDGGGDPINGVINESHAEVGSYAPNAWGLYDMHGNVWEWCLDWYKMNLGTDAQTDPNGPATASYRVMKSGCAYSGARSCRSARREHVYPNFEEFSGAGFRLFLTR